jgi:hypothetical protein
MIDGNCQGYASGQTFALNPVAALPHKTRLHEMAHIVLGHTQEFTMTDSERTPKDIKEVEAESVAYILCSILCLPGLEESRGYISTGYTIVRSAKSQHRKSLALLTKS